MITLSLTRSTGSAAFCTLASPLSRKHSNKSSISCWKRHFMVLRSAPWVELAALCRPGCDPVCREPLLSTELKPSWSRCRQPDAGRSAWCSSGQASCSPTSRRILYTRVTAPHRTHLPLKRAILSAQSEILLKLELTPLLFICLDELSREDTGPPGSHWAWLWTDLLFVSTLPNIASGH